ncbi:receptor kinase-like protein Xa21 [Salvia miltiorrhiza]|uniref:receptor kinase-like protein Xa21 n=1 Tax=Salvia miltiorrhiza TaxID=226208 RepID=UPI0025AD86CC|nr:receptor kinase-like protein Xa21 [Salvia miltiorrhiza]
MEKKLYAIFAFLTITFQMLSSDVKIPTSLATDQTALLSLKLHITSDPCRILATNWTNSSSICSWIGVTCSLRHPRVAALNLSNMALSGTIPPPLGHLSFLVSLDLTSNLFHGDLPQELSLLRRLKFISLRLNNFTGAIPMMFGQLPKLEYLNLRNNSFIGSIPKSLSNLANLRSLDLTSNSLSGEIPKEFGRLQSLQTLSVQSNHLSGAIPSAIFNISTLVTIALTGNELSGSLPTDMCSNLPSLTGIYLSFNQLSGAIPTNVSQCSRLEVLSLSYNSFSGQIPSEIGYLTSLQILYLSANNLNDILPHEIGNLQSLVGFYAEENEIEGSIDFSNFLNMSSLQEIYLWRNKFTGNLSRDVGNITTLTILELSENHFTASSRNAKKIKHILEYYESISGQVCSLEKSRIYYAKGVTTPMKRGISQALGFTQGGDRVNYLGSPLFVGRPKASHFIAIKDRIVQKFSRWAGLNLSMAGRICLVNSVIQSSIIHTMMVFRWPKSLLYALDRSCRNFIWTGKTDIKPSCAVKWSKCCAIKEEGGLGLRSFTVMNKSYLMRMAWKLIKGEAFPHRLMRSRYLDKFGHAKKHVATSSVWVGLKHEVDGLVNLSFAEIGDGVNVGFVY